MFRKDALVFLRANKAKALGMSIYSYIEACWCASLLNYPTLGMLFNLRYSGVGVAYVGSTSKLPVRGNPAIEYVIATIAIEV